MLETWHLGKPHKSMLIFQILHNKKHHSLKAVIRSILEMCKNLVFPSNCWLKIWLGSYESQNCLEQLKGGICGQSDRMNFVNTVH